MPFHEMFVWGIAFIMIFGVIVTQFIVSQFLIGFTQRSTGDYMVEFVIVFVLVWAYRDAPSAGLCLAAMAAGTLLSVVYSFLRKPFRQMVDRGEINDPSQDAPYPVIHLRDSSRPGLLVDKRI